MMDTMDTVGLIQQSVHHHMDTLSVEVLRTSNTFFILLVRVKARVRGLGLR